ncbi:POZ domain-containing protein [Cryptosporidium canis]|uniref:POZ domain-containing protein n=1 Tax=Cryptosporidium canis TaxID=195482 RepID=A0A9D5HWZ9_9CRYT|nr:POZ domain-containing protein [Cryptosporidium canis]
MERRVRLNVGGVFYETTSTTLLGVNGESNYFSACLSSVGMSVEEQAEKSSIELFIDRNGFLFQYVLDYLRTGTIVAVPEKDHIIKGLLIEADFYLLESLTTSLLNRLSEQNINKLNSKMSLMASQSQHQSPISSQNQSQSQIISQSQSNMSDKSDIPHLIYDNPKVDHHMKSNIFNYGCSHGFGTDSSVLKENEAGLQNNYLKFEFSLDEDF